MRVPAGEFATSHFIVSVRPGVEEHLWVTNDEFVMLVQLRSDRLATTYLLTELVEEPRGLHRELADHPTRPVKPKPD